MTQSRVGYRGRLDRLQPTSNFVERCNFCPGDLNQGGPTLDSEPKPTSKYVVYPTLQRFPVFSENYLNERLRESF